jgi:lipopolysaccharide transport protein LptA
MTLRQKAREVTFADNVHMVLTPAAQDEATSPDATEGSVLFTSSREPIDITSSRLDVSDAGKIAVFSTDVKAVQGDSTLTTPELEVNYEGNTGIGGGAAAQAGGDQPAKPKDPPKIRRIVAKKPVVITRGTSDVVSSDNAQFDVPRDTALLTGNVIMASGPDRRATSDMAELNQGADTALLRGNVVVTQGLNELRGSRLFVDRKGGHTQLTSPPEDGGMGRISARLTQADGKQRTAGKAAKGETGSGAQTQQGLFAFKTDPTAPVNVDAEQLDVVDAQKVAVFKGNVSASQGDFTISSAELHAYYKGGSGLADFTQPGADTSTQGNKSAGAELTRIEAKQHVIVTSKDGQTATGDWADFDTKTNKVMLGGDVVVTQGQNMVRGTRLVIDMVSGESKIDTAPAKTVAQPAGGGWATEAPDASSSTPESSGRASAVFFPQQLKDAKNAKKLQDGAAKAAPDGWSATMDPNAPGTNGN